MELDALVRPVEFGRLPLAARPPPRSFVSAYVQDLMAAEAMAVLDALGDHARHVLWPDELPYRLDMLNGVIGHRQVTDAYLADQARVRGGRLATFDRGLAALHRDVVDLLTT